MVTNRNDLVNEINMLEGNINRMCLTFDIEELERMYEFAKSRLDKIYEYNLKQIGTNN